jgi:hypothetical protein
MKKKFAIHNRKPFANREGLWIYEGFHKTLLFAKPWESIKLAEI